MTNNTTTNTINTNLNYILTYEPPCPPPSWGSSWDEERDYPGVALTLWFPVTPNGYVIPELTDISVMCCGEKLSDCWGSQLDGYKRAKRVIFRKSTLRAAEAEAVAYLEAAKAAVAKVIAAREVRLARRAETIRRAHETTLTVTPPELGPPW